VDVDRSIEHVGGVLAIDGIEQLVPGQNPAIGAEDRAEQSELDAREVDGVVATADLVAGWVDDQIAMAKDGLTLLALGTGIASAMQGARLARQEPEGAVPIERGTKPAEETPPAAAKAQRSLAGLGITNIASGVGLVIVNALMAQREHSRPPLRRALFRRSG